MRRPVVAKSKRRPRTEKLQRKTLAFTIDVTVDPAAVDDSLDQDDRRSPEAVVADEIASNLESVSYVVAVTVRRKTT